MESLSLIYEDWKRKSCTDSGWKWSGMNNSYKNLIKRKMYIFLYSVKIKEKVSEMEKNRYRTERVENV